MAQRTKSSVVGNTTTYTVTDAQGVTATVAITQGFGSGRTATVTAPLGIHQDGMLALHTLLLMLGTGLTP